jgi:hypothetical protein
MKTPIRDLWQRYKDNTTRVSDIVRQLSLAGIGLIWVLRPAPSAPGIAIPRPLVWPAVLIVGALTADLLQYAIASLVWRISASRAERGRKSLDDTVECPPGPLWLIEAFFAVKVVAVVVAYVLLLLYLWPRIW